MQLQANVNLTTEVALVRVSLPTLPDSAVNGGAREEELQAIVAQLLKVTPPPPPPLKAF